MKHTPDDKPTLILGAGLTGLSAAYVLHRNNVPVQVLESEAFVGGASRTIAHDRFRFDLGGHRLYTKSRAVLDLVNGLIGDELLTVRRRSRVYMNGRFVNYPLTFFNALSALGPMSSLAVAASYGVECVKRSLRERPAGSFEEWVVTRFGRKLYEIYFRPYSEKVWGVPCSELRADFAAQRIKGLSFREAVRNMIAPNRHAPATLASRFTYPRLGFGRIPEALANALPPAAVKLNASVIRVEHDRGRVTGVAWRTQEGEHLSECTNVISTIPISDLAAKLSPAPPDAVLDAAAGLRFRDLVIVFLMLDREQVTPDHWIYFASEDVFFGRMHEPKNWSADMAPPDKTSLVVEIFCFEGEPVWLEPDDAIARRVAERLEKLGMIRQSEMTAARVIRLKNAYPLYCGDYRERLDTIMQFLGSLKNLQTAGRNGRFCYTSADLCMDMGIKAARNLLGETHDLQEIGAGREYAES